MANTIELKQQIQQGAYDAAFVKLYGADVDVNAQRERYISVIDQFENEFGSGRSVLTDAKDYDTARNYWKVTKKRLKDEGSQLVTDCNQLKLNPPKTVNATKQT